MTRISKKVLKERVSQLAVLTNNDYTVGFWNSLAHVYVKSTGTMLITGTKRECKEADDMFIYGYRTALER